MQPIYISHSLNRFDKKNGKYALEKPEMMVITKGVGRKKSRFKAVSKLPSFLLSLAQQGYRIFCEVTQTFWSKNIVCFPPKSGVGIMLGNWIEIKLT